MHPERLLGVAVADRDVPPAELRCWHALGVRGLRFNQFFTAASCIIAAACRSKRRACSRWHLQL
jgi:uncharacterized protein involved in copper resistance